jgi:hypothetical protein
MAKQPYDSYFSGGGFGRMVEADLAKGPSRSVNPRPVETSAGYVIAEMIPQSVQDRELEQAAKDFSALQEATARLVRRGHADMPAPKVK